MSPATAFRQRRACGPLGLGQTSSRAHGPMPAVWGGHLLFREALLPTFGTGQQHLAREPSYGKSRPFGVGSSRAGKQTVKPPRPREIVMESSRPCGPIVPCQMLPVCQMLEQRFLL